MNLEAGICYKALSTGDARFDGVFFVGVSSTGIYCRPICPAKAPRRENCTFFPSAAAAERAGYRPCLRCRPELAPGNSQVDASSRLAAAAASRIEDGALTEGSVEDLASELGITDRHLRRVIETEYGVSPIELAQTQRLLLAKRLLTDTRLPITEVALASGFSSLRRFNALFKERYRLNPKDLRKRRPAETAQECLTCELAYRPPFEWDLMLGFLARRATCGVEAVSGGRYARTVEIGEHRGWVSIERARNKNALRVQVSAGLAPVLVLVLSRVKSLFDLAARPELIANHLGSLAAGAPGLRVPGAFDGFELAVRAILGQQVSVKGAGTLSGRFAAALGEPIETPFDSLTHLTPTAERVASAKPEDIVSLGILASRGKTILALGEAVSNRVIVLDARADVERTIAGLKELPGIGEWTAQYIAMRALSWPDAFPHTDLGVYRALGESSPKRVLEIAEAWRPWRSYAAMHLWNSLEIKS